MADLNTTTFSDLVAQGEIMWQKSRDEVPQVMLGSGLFKVDNFGPSQGDTRVFSEIDGEQYAKNRDEGDQSTEGRTQQGYTKTMYFVNRALTKSITKNMRMRNKYAEIERVWKDIGQTVLSRRELDMAHRIGFGTATSYSDMDGITVDLTVGDGFQMFYTAHTLKGSSTTYRNRLANDPQLSKGALENMEKMVVENTYNQFGEKMAMNYDILWVTDDPNTRNTAAELMQATAEISSPNNGVPNVYRGKYRVVSLPLVATDANGAPDTTKAKYWGLGSTVETPLHLSIEENLSVDSPASGMNTEDILTKDWVYSAEGSYGLVATRGTGITISAATA